jgi:hypothetical protein
MQTQFIKDESGELEKIFTKIIEEEFPLLKNARFLYTWRRDEKRDEEGQVILASARKLQNRDRDVFAYDFNIEVWKEYWEKISEIEKEKLAFHELLHCRIKLDEYGAKTYDTNGRLSIFIEPHDIIIRKFKAEVVKYGLDEGDKNIISFYKSVRVESDLLLKRSIVVNGQD